jgi:hypothetical protein
MIGVGLTLIGVGVWEWAGDPQDLVTSAGRWVVGAWLLFAATTTLIDIQQVWL